MVLGELKRHVQDRGRGYPKPIPDPYPRQGWPHRDMSDWLGVAAEEGGEPVGGGRLGGYRLLGAEDLAAVLTAAKLRP
jgi:hypothetical protein